MPDPTSKNEKDENSNNETPILYTRRREERSQLKSNYPKAHFERRTARDLEGQSRVRMLAAHRFLTRKRNLKLLKQKNIERKNKGLRKGKVRYKRRRRRKMKKGNRAKKH
mmetsp:Transcript_18328/g.27448  ORF Transcript_18328/g.27448 Transcript_18328/m.27448 type:complete len:110 (+) Transcript_18328:272-601(+)|eukprot:CAMPEP_0167744102 /NCGR_PEP_ID=MMETSP0110_2-20121227/2392_1 /TAXON_ID=629695 /ORGANISM="Gymnochlora sp., Strain CCMP2014" /LENGTH=109 /DNA_ID=CAMNT_0007628561 /DNA_START=244 /DNA_END=573 /DNA_ORIENTATION=+